MFVWFYTLIVMVQCYILAHLIIVYDSMLYSCSFVVVLHNIIAVQSLLILPRVNDYLTAPQNGNQHEMKFISVDKILLVARHGI